MTEPVIAVVRLSRDCYRQRPGEHAAGGERGLPSRQPVIADHTVGGVDNQNGAVASTAIPKGVGELVSLRHRRRKMVLSYRYRPEPQTLPAE